MKKIFLYIALLILVFACIFAFTGCYAQSEPSDFTHVLAVGVDMGEDGNYIFSFLAPQESGGENTLSHTNTLISVSAPSFGQAESIANFYNNRIINVTHMYLILFSKEVAQDTIEPIITSIANYNKTRPLVSIGITDGTAADYLKGIDETVTQSLPDFLQTFITNSSRVFAPLESLYRIYPQFESETSALALPLFINDDRTEEAPKPPSTPPMQSSSEIYENAIPVSSDSDGKNTEASAPLDFGMVIIKRFKAVAICGGTDTFYYNVVSGRLPYTYTNIDSITKNANYSIFLKKRAEPVVNINISGDAPKIDIVLEFDNHIITKFGVQPDEVDRIISDTCVLLENEIEEFLHRTASEYNADIFGFYSNLAPRCLTIEALSNYKWEEKYPYTEFNVTVKIKSSNIMYPERVLPNRSQEG